MDAEIKWWGLDRKLFDTADDVNKEILEPDVDEEETDEEITRVKDEAEERKGCKAKSLFL